MKKENSWYKIILIGDIADLDIISNLLDDLSFAAKQCRIAIINSINTPILRNRTFFKIIYRKRFWQSIV